MREVRKSIGGLGNLLFKQAYLISQMMEGKIPDVYVQSERFFKKHENMIRSEFEQDIGESIDFVSLHIRRGDYLNAHTFHINLCDTDYYQKAIAMFPDAKFIVFCKDNQGAEQDYMDRDWVDKFLIHQLGLKGRYQFSNFSNPENEDMNLMASCKHNIMANSSFSWWAAWLNPNPDKMVICPKNWFVDGIERTQLLDEWIKI